MPKRLEGKTALVTGATSNIGRAIASGFGGEGAHVVVSGRSVERGAQVVKQIIASGGRADFVAADLDGSPVASTKLAAEATRVLGGRIDILVNNAGIFPHTNTATTDESTFDKVYAINVKAPYFLTAAIAPAMADAGHGAIINLGSWIVRLAVPERALQLHQGRHRDPDQGVGGRVRSVGRSGQRHLTRRHSHSQPGWNRSRPASGRRGHDGWHSRWREWDPRRHRSCRGVPGQRRGRVRTRQRDRRRRRSDHGGGHCLLNSVRRVRRVRRVRHRRRRSHGPMSTLGRGPPGVRSPSGSSTRMSAKRGRWGTCHRSACRHPRLSRGR